MGVVREFNISSKKWSILFLYKDKKQIFQGRYGHSACLTPDRLNIIIFGGSEERAKNDVIAFDLVKNIFKRVAAGHAPDHTELDENTPLPRDFHQAVLDP